MAMGMMMTTTSRTRSTMTTMMITATMDLRRHIYIVVREGKNTRSVDLIRNRSAVLSNDRSLDVFAACFAALVCGDTSPANDAHGRCLVIVDREYETTAATQQQGNTHHHCLRRRSWAWAFGWQLRAR